MSTTPSTRWRKSSASGTGTNTCVEVAALGDQIAVRDSTDQQGGMLSFESTEWVAFASALKRDEFR